MQDPANGLLRIHLPGTGVKIALATAHFHGFGVARAGPWNTWVNKSSKRKSRGAVRSPPALTHIWLSNSLSRLPRLVCHNLTRCDLGWVRHQGS
jgi:hypothetical protein